MKHITRLALTLAMASLASLAPLAHADDQLPGNQGIAPLVAPVVPTERSYDYYDEDGYGTMVVSDGPKYNWGRPIYVTLYQNGYTFYGEGKRKYANAGTGYLAYCDFWLYAGSTKVKFKGYLPIFEGYSGYGNYWYNGYGPAHYWSVSY
jgi:hypothetical protein